MQITDDPAFAITFNYELLDDAYMSFPVYKVYHDVISPEEKVDRNEIYVEEGKDGYAVTKRIWSEEDHHLLDSAAFPTGRLMSSAELKENHPLMIMVREKRTALLGHPLCMALVRHKWNRFGRYIYFFLLFLYWLFVAAVTLFTINTPAPYSAKQVVQLAIHYVTYAYVHRLKID